MLRIHPDTESRLGIALDAAGLIVLVGVLAGIYSLLASLAALIRPVLP